MLASRAMSGAARVEVAIPVYNEEAALPVCVERLTGFLEQEMPGAWGIVISNNASTDGTAAVAARLADADPRVRVLELAGRGRGRAIRAAWEQSRAEVVAYTDVDLSTELRHLPELVACIRAGSDLAVASRLLEGARVERGLVREVLSRGFNRAVRLGFRTRFTDAQCGFKAIRREAARALLPHVRSTGWMFDAELLILAEKNGFRIAEIPVEWVDDPDSRVRYRPALAEAVRELGRLRLSPLRIATPLPAAPASSPGERA